MNVTKFFTQDKFGLLIDFLSMLDQSMHGSGTHLVSTEDGGQLELERKQSGSGNVNCHVFTIGDSELNILDRKLSSV